MKKIISFITIICVCSVFFTGCNKKTEEASIESAPTVTNVTVFDVVLSDINNEVNYTGEIKALEESDVAPKVSATIRTINYDIGDYVDAGTILAVLDDTDYRLVYNQALAAYNQAVAAHNSALNSHQQVKSQAETTLSAAQMEYDNALNNYNRQKALFDTGAISKVAFEAAETRLNSAELNLSSAKTNYDTAMNSTLETSEAAIDSAKAALASAENNLKNTTIIAPISGYIGSKNGNVGQIASAGVPMFSIKSTDIVNVEISVTESVIPYINVGTNAVITVDTANLSNINGVVTAVNTVKNPQTGMYTVRIKINNSDNSLKIGMTADVLLQTQSTQGAVIIPNDSIMQDNKGYYVYVVNGNVTEKREVTIGISNNDHTEITSGLTKGEKIVVSGKEYISEKNNTVNIIEE